LEVPEVEATSGTSLYVGNLTWATTSVQLREVFSEYSVKSAEVKAGYDGRSRGYGIVTFESEEVIECLRLPWLAFDCY
jgi:RNA recognition motif-containing protein